VTERAPEPLAIGAREQMMLAPLLRDLIAGLGQAPSAAGYRELLAEVEAGTVAPERFPQIENFLELGLHTGRFRSRFGASGEEALVRLFHQTPRGAAIAGSVAAVNQALTALAGQEIAGLSLAAHGPDAYSLSVETDRCRLTVRIDRSGVRVGDVELAV
jgi:hypothetical protein